jgi:hypothetical protein
MPPSKPTVLAYGSSYTTVKHWKCSIYSTTAYAVFSTNATFASTSRVTTTNSAFISGSFYDISSTAKSNGKWSSSISAASAISTTWAFTVSYEKVVSYKHSPSSDKWVSSATGKE